MLLNFLISIVFISGISAQGTFCSFEFLSNDYTCRLINQTITHSGNMSVVGGDHEENFGDINVQRLEQTTSIIQVFPKLLIDRFVNLRYLTLRSVEMRIWDGQIENCARLQEIDLSGNGFLSFNPRVFQECDRLSVLTVNQNRITGILAESFIGLFRLDTLSLANNIIRSITNLVLKPIGNLNTLILDNNELSEMTEEALAAVPNLQILSLKNNILTSWNVHILRFNPRIQRLFLSGNRIKTLEANTFSLLRNLVELWIGNWLEEIPAFEGMNSLEILVLSENRLKHVSRESFVHMRNLKKLYLDKNQIETFDFALSQNSPRILVNLEYLSMNNNSIGWFEDSSFESLTNLMHLAVSFNQFRRIPYDYLRPVLPLRTLDITRNFVSQIDPRIFQESENLHLLASGNVCIDDNFFLNSTFDMENLQDCFSSGLKWNVNILLLISSIFIGVL